MGLPSSHRPVGTDGAADAIEKLTRDDPAPLAPHKTELIGGRFDDGSKEVGWHLAALIARLDLTPPEANTVFASLDRRTRTSGSRIVAVMALQAAADLSARHPQLQKQFQQMLAAARTSPAASLRAQRENCRRAQKMRDLGGSSKLAALKRKCPQRQPSY